MSFGDHVETRSELEAAELDRENRVADRMAERRKDAVREHVEGWTRLLERAERCLSCDPDAGSSYVVAHAIRASIGAGTRKDDASRIRPTDGPPRLLVEIVTAGGVQVGDVLLLDGECCKVTDRGSRIGFTLWFGRTPEAFELDQPVVRVLDAAVMERGRPDDELEAALDGDNPEPPLRSMPVGKPTARGVR
jgi:hypothetical protein